MTPSPSITPLAEWDRLIEEIRSQKGLVFILGATHSGKTSLAKYLTYALSQRGERVALLDGDIGQSIFGPPTTLNLALLSPTSDQTGIDRAMAAWFPHHRYFVGSNTPAGHFLPLVIGLKKLADKASQWGGITILDTTGFVTGGAAIELKRRKIELLQPRHIIAIQRSDELEDILAGLPELPILSIHRLPIHPRTRIKTPEERQAYRQRKYAQYFQELTEYQLALDRVRLWSTYRPVKDKLAGLPNTTGLLLGLNDQENLTIAVGILRDIDPQGGRITFIAPPLDPQRIRIIHFGVITLTPLGQDRSIAFEQRP